MAFKVTIQTAPERRGVIGSPSSWSGTSTTTVTMGGTYTGTTDKTYTVTNNNVSDITIGSGTDMLDWTDGTESGKLAVGATYTAGDELTLNAGVTVAFSVGSAKQAELFTVAVTSANRVRADHSKIDGDGNPVDINVTNVGIINDDIISQTYDGRVAQQIRAQRFTVDMDLDYLNDAQIKTLERMRSGRYPLMVNANFGLNTLLWHPGGAALPVVGRVPTYGNLGSSTAPGSYQDPITGLFRVASAGDIRTGPGVEESSRSVSNEWDRVTSPLTHPHVGKGLICCRSSTNYVTTFHPANGALTWTTTGSATASWDDQTPPVLDPKDTGWAAKFRAGSLRASIPTGSGINSASHAITGSQTYSSHVWVKGSPSTTWLFSLYVGNGTPSTLAKSTVVPGTLSLDRWLRVGIPAHTVGASDNVAQIRISSLNGSGTLYVSAQQIELNTAPTELIETDGAAASTDGYLFVPDEKPPNGQGTLSFWVFWCGTNSGSNNVIVTTGSGPKFSLEVDPTTSPDDLQFHTDSSGAANSLKGDIPGSSLVPMSWYHIAVTWQASSTAGSIDRAMYINGSLVASDTTTAWGEWTSTIAFGSTALAGSPRYQDIRIDRDPLSATEIKDVYDSIASDEGGPFYRRVVGRTFRISSINSVWLAQSNPDKYVASLTLEEIDRDDANVVVPA